MSTETFAKEIAEGRYQPAYPEVRTLTAIEIDANLYEAEVAYRDLADGTVSPEEEGDPAERAWLEYVAEVGFLFDVGRSHGDEYVAINEALALGRRWFLDRWRFLQTPYGQATFRVDEEAKRLGVADQPEAVDVLRRELALRIASEAAKSMTINEGAASEAQTEEMPTRRGGISKNHLPPPIADPRSLPPLLTPIEAAAILRCTVGAFFHMVDELPEGVVSRRSKKTGSKLLVHRDVLLAYNETLPAARKNARGIDIQKGKEKHS